MDFEIRFSLPFYGNNLYKLNLNEYRLIPTFVCMKDKITVLLADDHPIVREGIRAYLSEKSNLKIVGEAGDGEEALAKAKEFLPDILLLDIRMPKLSGIDVAKQLKKFSPKTKIIILTVYKSREYAKELVSLGVLGYMLKDASPEKLYRAIEKVHMDNYFFSDEISDLILKAALNNFSGIHLSRREEEVLKFITNGMSNKEMAAHLEIEYPYHRDLSRTDHE